VWPVPEARFTPKAQDDLNDIWDYTFTRWDGDQADRYVTMIVKACQDLATGRVTGRGAEDVKPGYSNFRTGSHIVFYRHVHDATEDIEVVRILHERMDSSRHFS
jgi:toxin ParE1/3/4